MANPNVTFTFTNSTPADATQVTQNFTDLINDMTDGTKSFSIDALTVGGAALLNGAVTVGGAALLNGAVTLGNASGDDITVTGSLASAIPVKTNSAFDIGDSTHALRAAYVNKIQGGTTAGCEHVGRTDGIAPSSGTIGYLAADTRDAGAIDSSALAIATASPALAAGIYMVYPSAEHTSSAGASNVVYSLVGCNIAGNLTGRDTGTNYIGAGLTDTITYPSNYLIVTPAQVAGGTNVVVLKLRCFAAGLTTVAAMQIVRIA